MDKILFNIENQIYETFLLCKNFFQGINLVTFFLILFFLYIFFIRHWSFKKMVSGFFSMLVLLIIYVHVTAFFAPKLDAETAHLVLPIINIVALLVAAMIFIYHTAIKE